MCLVSEALSINLVDVFRSRWPDREPSVCRYHLDPANRRVITWRSSHLCDDLIAGQLRRSHSRGIELSELKFRLGSDRRVYSRVAGGSELGAKHAQMLARVLSCDRGDLRRKQSKDQSVLIGCPGTAVAAQKACPCALLATKAEARIK